MVGAGTETQAGGPQLMYLALEGRQVSRMQLQLQCQSGCELERCRITDKCLHISLVYYFYSCFYYNCIKPYEISPDY